jgi:hypothetical protein
MCDVFFVLFFFFSKNFNKWIFKFYKNYVLSWKQITYMHHRSISKISVVKYIINLNSENVHNTIRVSQNKCLYMLTNITHAHARTQISHTHTRAHKQSTNWAASLIPFMKVGHIHYIFSCLSPHISRAGPADKYAWLEFISPTDTVLFQI